MENNSSFLRKIVVVLLILLFFVLQCSVFNSLAMGGIIPNLMIILTSSFGFMRGEKEGLLIGFSCGLLCDIFFGSFLGFYAMVMMYIGFVNGKFSRIFYPEDIKLPYYCQRHFLWIDLLHSDVSFERAFSFPVLFYKCDPAGGTLHHRCYDYFVSSDPED